LEAKTRDDEMVRRKLHNAIQELKGNIRVICRARPALGVEKVEEGVFGFSEFGGARTLEVSAPSALSATGKPQPPKKWTFNFDRVFAPNSTQSQVFDEISGLVQSALDGYNVCIFTYGQTGSGKTYTMEGPNHPTAETRGMIPRAVQQIFEVSDYLKEKGWSYRFEAFFLEIYNESIRDLLTTKKVDSDSKSDKFQIKHNPDNTTLVTNLTVGMSLCLSLSLFVD
jgi:kinesin family protein C1